MPSSCDWAGTVCMPRARRNASEAPIGAKRISMRARMMFSSSGWRSGVPQVAAIGLEGSVMFEFVSRMTLTSAV